MKPTMRFKQRYVSFRVVGSEAGEPMEKEVRDFVFASLLEFFGEEGFSRLAFKLISYEHERREGVLRCERGMLGKFIGALALFGRIGGREARIECISSSGTIAGLKTK